MFSRWVSSDSLVFENSCNDLLMPTEYSCVGTGSYWQAGVTPSHNGLWLWWHESMHEQKRCQPDGIASQPSFSWDILCPKEQRKWGFTGNQYNCWWGQCLLHISKSSGQPVSLDPSTIIPFTVRLATCFRSIIHSGLSLYRNFHVNGDTFLNKTNQKLNHSQTVDSGVQDCILANALHLFCSPHGAFTCRQPKPAQIWLASTADCKL